MKDDVRSERKPKTDDPILAELRDLVNRAQGGDASLLPRIRTILDQNEGIWRRVGDIERQLVQAWVGLLSGTDPLAAESVKREAERLRTELEGPNPTALERLLAGQVVTCWLETTAAQNQLAVPGGTLAQGAFNARWATSAQRRYLAAIRALTTVRSRPGGLVPVAGIKVYDPGCKKKA